MSFAEVAEELDHIKPSLSTTDKQNELVEAVLSGQHLYIGMGGGIRGTKTFGMLIVLVILCKLYPGSRWAIVRSDLPTLRRNVVPSIGKLRMMGLQNEMAELNQSVWSYKFFNGSEILLFPESFQQDPDLERWKGLEVNGFLLEEGSELQEASANKAIERAGSWIIPPTEFNPEPVQPPPFVFFTFNPTPNWPKQWFWDPFKAGSLKSPFHFIPATAADNPYIPEAVHEAWKNLPPEEYNRFVLGEWEFLEDPDQLIKAEWVWAAQNVEPIMSRPPRLGVDVGRYGDDPTTIATMEGNALLGTSSHPKLSIDRTIDIVAIRMHEAPFPEEARVDGVGLGAGVVDGLIRKGYKVTDVIAGAKPIERKDSFFKFKNLRSQMWWEFREKLRQRLISFPPGVSDELVADLTTIRYTIDKDKVIQVESKDQLKKRLGRSTDEGDAVIQADFDFPPPPKAPILPGTHGHRRFG